MLTSKELVDFKELYFKGAYIKDLEKKFYLSGNEVYDIISNLHLSKLEYETALEAATASYSYSSPAKKRVYARIIRRLKQVYEKEG